MTQELEKRCPFEDLDNVCNINIDEPCPVCGAFGFDIDEINAKCVDMQ